MCGHPQVECVPVNTAHRHQLAIRGAKTGISAIRREHEPVARSHVNRLPLIDGIVVRRNNANFTVTMPDGTAYVSLLTDTGHCMDDRDRCRDLGRELALFEQFVRNNAREFRAGLSWPDASTLTIRMGFSGRDCFFYEPNNGTEIHPSKSPI